MKKLSTAKIWQFAAGQFGWAMLSGIISNWLVYFSAGSGSYQSGTDGIYSAGTGSLWNLYHYRGNYRVWTDF